MDHPVSSLADDIHLRLKPIDSLLSQMEELTITQAEIFDSDGSGRATLEQAPEVPLQGEDHFHSTSPDPLDLFNPFEQTSVYIIIYDKIVRDWVEKKYEEGIVPRDDLEILEKFQIRFQKCYSAFRQLHKIVRRLKKSPDVTISQRAASAKADTGFYTKLTRAYLEEMDYLIHQSHRGYMIASFDPLGD
ncbi:hypothetical protein ABW19_dt0210124 [Dactylella cylindrospora]|nr:hypothetical protein ABW19_dt0210124 [Dactylella cylindrospora]